jgi:protein O-mannosyl-transferase
MTPTGKRPPGSRGGRSRRAPAQPKPRVPISLLGVLVAAVCVAYIPSFSGGFVGDDIDAIVANPHIRSLWPIHQALTAPSDTTAAGRPVVALSLALNYALAPDDARDAWDPPAPGIPVEAATDPYYRNLWGYHAFNLAVHMVAALALFGVVRRSLELPALRGRFSADAIPLAFAIALLWALHPLNTAAVTYIIQRAESLMGLFLLLTLYCSIRSTEATRSRWRWIAAATVACGLGMASKEVHVVAPILVALWIWILRPGESLLEGRRLPLFGALAATWLLLLWLVLGGVRSESVGFGLSGWTSGVYVRTQAEVILHYLRLAIVPSPLVFMYAWPPATSWVSVAPQVMMLAVLAGATVLALVRRHPAALLGAWFFLVLAPSSSVLPIATEVAAEHRMYLPLAAVVATIVFSIHGLSRRLVASPRRAVVTMCLTGFLAVALGSVTYARNNDYRSMESLLQDTVKKRPANVRARVAYGGLLLQMERFPEAEFQLRTALAIGERTPGDTYLTPMAHMYLGSALAAQAQAAEGIIHLERALELSPRLDEAHALLGEAYLQQGRLPEAAAAYERAIALMPHVTPVLDRAATVLALWAETQAQQGHRREAAATLRRTIDAVRRAGDGALVERSSEPSRSLRKQGRAIGDQQHLPDDWSRLHAFAKGSDFHDAVTPARCYLHGRQ